MTDETAAPPRLEMISSELLSDNWGRLTRHTYDFRRSDGTVQRLTREAYDRGHGATILLYSRETGTVVLTRQFRLPAWLTGHPEDLVETCAGLLDARDPETAIRHEAEEETGFHVGEVERLWEVYMSPGSVTERLTFFVAPYTRDMKRSDGGGVEAEGEEIEVLELPLEEALAMVRRGEIIDAKTIMLLQHAALEGLCRND